VGGNGHSLKIVDSVGGISQKSSFSEVQALYFVQKQDICHPSGTGEKKALDLPFGGRLPKNTCLARYRKKLKKPGSWINHERIRREEGGLLPVNRCYWLSRLRKKKRKVRRWTSRTSRWNISPTTTEGKSSLVRSSRVGERLLKVAVFILKLNGTTPGIVGNH